MVMLQLKASRDKYFLILLHLILNFLGQHEIDGAIASNVLLQSHNNS